MKAEDVDLAFYIEGMEKLFKSGIFRFMEEQAKVKQVPDESGNYAQLWIAEGSRSAGYNSAISDLLLFRERYLQDKDPYVPVRDYGGRKALVERKVITQDEADKLGKQFAIPTPKYAAD